MVITSILNWSTILYFAKIAYSMYVKAFKSLIIHIHDKCKYQFINIHYDDFTTVKTYVLI